MNNGLRVLILTLEELDPETLKCLWRDHVELRKYFVGVTMNLNGKKLTLFSKDFCQAVFTNQWYFEYSLATVLMSKDHIDYAVYVIRQTGIDDAMQLAALAMRNGRKAALDALPQQELVWKLLQLMSIESVLISCVSYELYDLLGLWGTLFKDKPNPIQRLVALVDRVIFNCDTVMAQWITLHLDELIKPNARIFNTVLMQYNHTLQVARIQAKLISDSPPSIIALVDSLLARIQ